MKNTFMYFFWVAVFLVFLFVFNFIIKMANKTERANINDSMMINNKISGRRGDAMLTSKFLFDGFQTLS